MGQLLKRWGQSTVRQRDVLGAGAILLLATVLRAGWPALTEFKFSEARLSALALELTQNGRLPLVGVPSSAGFDHSPISVYLFLPPFVFTSNPIPATIYGGLIGAAAVALCLWLARRWPGGGSWAAWIGALLFAVSPWSVAFSRKIWQIVFVPLLTLCFVGLIVSALIEKETGDSPGPRRWNLTWAVVVYALLIQVHPSAVSLAPALALWLLVFRRQLRLGPLLAGAALAAITGIPFIVNQTQSGWPAVGALKALPRATWDLSAVRLAWDAITGRGIHALAGRSYPLLQTVPQLDWFFNLIGWLAAGSALWLAWRTWRRWRSPEPGQRHAAQVDLVLLSWLVVPVLFSLRHSLDLYLHFFALVAPAAYLLIGRAVQDILAHRWSVSLRVPVTGGIVVLVVAQVVALVQMGRFVATHDTPGGFDTPLARYLAVADQAVAAADERGAAEVLVVGQGDSTVVDETPAIFDVLLRGRVAYRFVDGGATALFPAHRAVAIVTPGAGEGAAWYSSLQVSSISLQDGYRLVDLDGSWPAAAFESVPGLRLFQNGVEAQGYAWQLGTGSPTPSRLWLLWQVLWLNPDETHFFVRVVDQAGDAWSQADSSGIPVASRQKGDRIVSGFDITIGEGVLAEPDGAKIGQYLYPRIVNVPLIDQAGNPAADTATIGLWGREP